MALANLPVAFLGDKSNPRYFMGTGLILTGVFNVCFGFSSTLWFFILFWGLNGWFQGFGWPPCARLLSYWYSEKSRGTWWSFWSTAHNIGGGLIPIIVTACIHFAGWRYALFIPGFICIIFGFILFERMRDTPQSLGLPSADEIEDISSPVMEMSPETKRPSTKQLLFEHVLRNKYLWFLALANMFVYVVRTGVNDWTVLYLSEARGFSLIEAGGTIPWFEAGGFLGMILAGYLSDRLVGNGRGIISASFMMLLSLPLSLFWLAQTNSYVICSMLLFLNGIFLFGPQMLVGCTAVERTDKRAAGTASGFTGIFGYLGAAVAGYPFGVLVDRFGWSGFFFALLCASILGSLCFLPL